MENVATGQLLAKVREAGVVAGKATGSWVIDGNTTQETARAILKGIEDGDPGIMDIMQPSPLSGEFAGGKTPQSLADEYEIDPEEEEWILEDACVAFEDGFSEGYWAEVERSARATV